MFTRFSTLKRFRVAGSIVAASLLLISGMLSSSSAFAGTTGSLSGIAVDASTQAPIAGAKVTVSGPSDVETTTTDKTGHFTFASLPPDTYSVQLAASGYSGADLRDVEIVADNLVTVTLSASSSTGAR